jgi:hypothetical protein
MMPNDFAVHVCLISDQQAPNLLPVLDNAFSPREKKVVMLVSPKMKKNSRNLRAVLKTHGVSAEEISLDDAYDFDEIQRKLLEFLTQNEDKNIALNLTGGTKIMTIAAQSVFALAERPMFYVKESDNTVLVIRKNNPKGDTVPLNNRLNLEEYLLAYGYEVTASEKKPVEQHPQLTYELVTRAERFERSISTVNWYGHEARNNPALKVARDENDKITSELLELFAQYKLLRLTAGEISFADEAARAYVAGTWLEEHVYGVLNALSSGKIQDTRRNLEMRSLQGNTANKVKNEFDVALLAQNRLHQIECKTGQLKKEEKGSDVLYKLNTLSQETGLKTKAMLVSYQKLQDWDKERAHVYGIKVVAGKNLGNLKNDLTDWINK